jgi:hypothetical protein
VKCLEMPGYYIMNAGIIATNKSNCPVTNKKIEKHNRMCYIIRVEK